MNVQITKAVSSEDIKQFIRMPWTIYRGDPHWVPPLIMDMKKLLNREKNPFFQHSEAEFFLAKTDGEVVGRIAAIANHNHNRFHNESTGFFGFFESVDDQAVADALFDAAATWLSGNGMTSLRGPTNFSTNETCGFLIEGFDSAPAIMMTYNPEYYLKLVNRSGFKQLKMLYAYELHSHQPIPERFKRIAERALDDKSIRFRTINLKNFHAELDIVKKIYNEAWESNWGFVPMTDAEFEHMAKDLRPAIDPEIVYVAEIDGEPAGFSLTLPDYNQILKKLNGRLFPFGLIKLLLDKKKVNRVRVITLGVRKKFQNKRGLAPTFYYQTYTRGIERGYHTGEFSWILDDNLLMNRALVSLGAKLYKKYAIYEKPLQN